MAALALTCGGSGTAVAADLPIPALPAPPWSSDEFYVPPSPLPKGEPGDLLKARLIPADTAAFADVRQLMYLSKDNRGKLTPVTAALMTPLGLDLKANNPLVVETPGTRGQGDHCAPSRQANLAQANPGSPEQAYAEFAQLLAHGISVVITDYDGLGTPGDHSYLVARPEGQAALDALRAVQQVEGSGVTSRSALGISGYSQGGQGAAAAAELAHSYAPELNIKGVLAGGVPRDMLAEVNHLSGNPTAGAGFAFAALVGIAHAFPSLALEPNLTTEGKKIIAKVRQNCYPELLLDYGTTSVSQISSPDILSLPDWQAAFGASELGMNPPRFPAYLYHSYSDTIVPFHQGQELYHDWCARGGSVAFEALPGDHASGLALGPPLGLEWLVAQLRGDPAPNGCREVSALPN
jgi:hypothetical protein